MALSKVRMPFVAGQFYPGDPQALKKELSGFMEGAKAQSAAIGCVLPHAGYAYSGKVAAETVAGIKPKKTVILLGPNHTGDGEAFSILTRGSWQTPLGRIQIDQRLAQYLLERSLVLKEDAAAQEREHSLEVELPLLQFCGWEFQIVPIVIMSQEETSLEKLGKEIAAALKNLDMAEETLLLASSDLTHYEPLAAAQEKDQAAINAILELNPQELLEKVKKLNISICGAAPVTAMLYAAKELGAKKGKLVRYTTSAQVTRDESSVVGYAGIIIT